VRHNRTLTTQPQHAGQQRKTAPVQGDEAQEKNTGTGAQKKLTERRRASAGHPLANTAKTQVNKKPENYEDAS
jgi:hypothetical protein